jgi:guanylate kinase
VTATGRRGLLVVVSGPSGVGKDSILDLVFQRDPSLAYSVSYTTRPPRAGEVDGVDYSFVSEAEFDRLVAEGELLEWAHVHNHRYGTGRGRIEAALAAGKDIVLNVDVQGGAAVRQQMPDALLVFIAPPSLEELDRRRRDRGTDSAADLAVRAADAAVEMGFANRYDAVVVNDDLERAAGEVTRLIQERRERQP